MLWEDHSRLIRNRFLMVSIYYWLYIIYTLTGFLFDLDQSNICRDIQKIERLIRTCLPILQKIYEITKRLRTSQAVEEYFPGFLAFINCTEQQIPRSNGKIMIRMYYLGKKKKHTVKNLYMVDKNEIIFYKTKHKQVGKNMITRYTKRKIILSHQRK